MPILASIGAAIKLIKDINMVKNIFEGLLMGNNASELSTNFTMCKNN